MKKIVSFLTVIAVLLSCFSFNVSAVGGTTYYIDSESGNDTNNGLTPDSAWSTLEKASEKTYSAGDKILFKAGGIYTGSFTAKGNGEETESTKPLFSYVSDFFIKIAGYILGLYVDFREYYL